MHNSVSPSSSPHRWSPEQQNRSTHTNLVRCERIARLDGVPFGSTEGAAQPVRTVQLQVYGGAGMEQHNRYVQYSCKCMVVLVWSSTTGTYSTAVSVWWCWYGAICHTGTTDWNNRQQTVLTISDSCCWPISPLLHHVESRLSALRKYDKRARWKLAGRYNNKQYIVNRY
jgi:hypothetical protein